MESFIDFIRTNPSVKRIQVNEILLAEYQCPLSETRYDIWSDQNYFVFVVGGQKKWFTIDQEVLVKEGDCLFVRRGAHSVYQYFDEDFCALVLFVPDEFIRKVLIDNRIELPVTDTLAGHDSLFRVKMRDSLAAYLTSFFSYLSDPKLPGDPLMELKFRELILVVATGTHNKDLPAYFDAVCRTAMPSLRDVMEDNFYYPMSIEEFARLSGRSLSSFKRDFKDVYRTSPGRWLTQKRLEHAKHLLTHTDKSVLEIVLDCGFKNASHFSRVFKERFDMTPLECRSESLETA